MDPEQNGGLVAEVDAVPVQDVVRGALPLLTQLRNHEPPNLETLQRRVAQGDALLASG